LLVYWINVAITFILVCFLWIFFRANTIGDAFYFINHMFDGLEITKTYLKTVYNSLGFDLITVVNVFISIIILAVVDFAQLKRDMVEELGKKPLFIRWTIYVAIVLMVLFNSPFDSGSEFIYFKF
jgi:alginate O-acetyltransferase complex protein AlgI